MHRVIVPFLVSALLAASLVTADTAVAASDRQATVSTYDASTRVGDAVRGASRNAELYCEACHGENGNSESMLVPSLAGQQSVYMAGQLLRYRSGERVSGEMQSIAASLNDADIVDLSAYYAAQTLQAPQTARTDQPARCRSSSFPRRCSGASATPVRATY